MQKNKSMPTFRPGSSAFHRLDPRFKLAAVAFAIAIIVMSENILTYLLAFAVTLSFAALSLLKLSESLKPILYLSPFFTVIFLMNLLFFNSSRPWARWWIFSPSLPGLLQGVQVVCKVALVMEVSACVLATTPPVEMTYAIESLISPLRFVGVPVGQIALIISVAIEFIPSLFEEFNMIREAQTARGAQFESANLFKRGKAYIPLFLPIFFTAFRRADELSLAMEARGYRTGKAKVSRHFARPGLKGFIVLALGAALTVLQAFLMKFPILK